MNPKQRFVIFVGIVAVALMLLVPPWKKLESMYRPGAGPTDYYSAGYGFLLYPPSRNAVVDASRLAVQVLLVAVVCGGLVFLFHRKPNP